MELTQKTCVACEGGVEPLTPEQARELGSQIPDWTIEDKAIRRTFEFKDFMQAMDFANGIARIAEEQNHHPDLHISWGKVGVELSTHKIGGLSENDFIMAAKIDGLLRESQPGKERAAM